MLTMFSPVPLAQPVLVWSASTPTVTAVSTAAEQPEEAEYQERDEDEERKEVPIAFDYDGLTVGRGDDLGVVAAPSVVTPIAISKIRAESDRHHDGQDTDNDPTSHNLYLLRVHTRSNQSSAWPAGVNAL
jgi:hypothetical protein